MESNYKTLFSHLKCRKNTESKNAEVVKTKCKRLILISNCAAHSSKKSTSIKEQEASGLLSGPYSVKDTKLMN